MPTYIYETIPSDSDSQPRRFEVFQRMTDSALEFDPETGDRVKRVITGGQGIKGKILRKTTVVNKASAAATACGCATGLPHTHHHGHSHSHNHSHGHHHGHHHDHKH